AAGRYDRVAVSADGRRQLDARVGRDGGRREPVWRCGETLALARLGGPARGGPGCDHPVSLRFLARAGEEGDLPRDEAFALAQSTRRGGGASLPCRRQSALQSAGPEAGRDTRGDGGNDPSGDLQAGTRRRRLAAAVESAAGSGYDRSMNLYNLGGL